MRILIERRSTAEERKPTACLTLFSTTGAFIQSRPKSVLSLMDELVMLKHTHTHTATPIKRKSNSSSLSRSTTERLPSLRHAPKNKPQCLRGRRARTIVQQTERCQDL